MRATADGATPACPPDAARLVELLRGDDVDAALDAGLMDLTALALQGLDPADRELLAGTRARLRSAWEARERHRRREARLARRKAERATARTPATPARAQAPALPAAAAAALARARARANRS